MLGGYELHKEGSNSLWEYQESLPIGANFEVGLKEGWKFGVTVGQGQQCQWKNNRWFGRSIGQETCPNGLNGIYF